MNRSFGGPFKCGASGRCYRSSSWAPPRPASPAGPPPVLGAMAAPLRPGAGHGVPLACPWRAVGPWPGPGQGVPGQGAVGISRLGTAGPFASLFPASPPCPPPPLPSSLFAGDRYGDGIHPLSLSLSHDLHGNGAALRGATPSYAGALVPVPPALSSRRCAPPPPALPRAPPSSHFPSLPGAFAVQRASSRISTLRPCLEGEMGITTLPEPPPTPPTPSHGPSPPRRPLFSNLRSRGTSL